MKDLAVVPRISSWPPGGAFNPANVAELTENQFTKSTTHPAPSVKGAGTLTSHTSAHTDWEAGHVPTHEGLGLGECEPVGHARYVSDCSAGIIAAIVAR